MAYNVSILKPVGRGQEPRWGCNNSEIVAKKYSAEQEPRWAAITVRLLQKKYSADQEPRWGCNNSEIVATSIVLMIWQPSEALLIGCTANLH